MKKLYFILFFASLFAVLHSCSYKSTNAALQRQVDSLKTVVNLMKPGLGEYMLGIQMHHDKLYFAEAKHNWGLANFEIDEMKEQFDKAVAVVTDRTEAKVIPMIYPILDSLKQNIKNQDTASFARNYLMMTNTCNACHMVAKFEFNKIKVPEHSMFQNQDW